MMKVSFLILLVGTAIAAEIPVPGSLEVAVFGRFSSAFCVNMQGLCTAQFPLIIYIHILHKIIIISQILKELPTSVKFLKYSKQLVTGSYLRKSNIVFTYHHITIKLFLCGVIVKIGARDNLVD
jgi:hypothetical protein